MSTDPGDVTAAPSHELVHRLAALPVLESVPREEIAWLLQRGEVRTHGAGEVVRTAGSPITEMSVLLSGCIGLYVPREGGSRKVMDVETGYVLGVVPYSRMQTAPGNLVAETDTMLLALHQKHFPDLVSRCPAITTALVHRMLDRAREFSVIELHDERLLALGRLASGLAHELNNPASAAASGARWLGSLLDRAEGAAKALAAARPSDAQLAAIDALRAQCARAGPARSALEAADREDEFTEWLERHGIDPSVAEPLTSSDTTLRTLDDLAAALDAETLDAALTWVASTSAAREVTGQIRSATTRMHDLVGAVKGFTFMDRAGVPEEIDIAQGLAHTLAMVETRRREKAVELRVETADDLPAVYGYGSEINQVWSALIDNAIDAVGREGSVTVTASARGDSVVVRIADDGPGIPDENRARVFDPFFTTKAVGEGAGLGLHQARRTVHLHRGDIGFTSEPGRTVFRVRLPVAVTTKTRAGSSDILVEDGDAPQ